MTNTYELRLIETRAKALLTLNLTSRKDLFATEQTDDFGLDYIIQITQNGKQTGRVFGIELKASVYASDTSLIQFPTKILAAIQDNPYPVCLCFFFMSNDKGLYRWLIEPIVDRNNSPKLLPKFEMDPFQTKRHSVNFHLSEFTDFDKKGLSDMVDIVNRWYDAR